MQHPYAIYPPPSHMNKSTLKNSSCGTDAAIKIPGLSREYSGYPKKFEALGLISISTMYTLELTQALTTEVANYISKFSTINVPGFF